MKSKEILTDVSEMPYGKEKGTEMANLDAEYLLWLYDNEKAFQGVKEYVESNMEVLRSEVEPKENDDFDF